MWAKLGITLTSSFSQMLDHNLSTGSLANEYRLAETDNGITISMRRSKIFTYS